MKRLTLSLFALLLLFGMYSCQKEDKVSTPDNPNPAGEVTQVGTAPNGTPMAHKTIGPAGGTLSSVDGRMKLTVPAGAFTENQEVMIQAISNFNPLAINEAYRITPHNVEFAKPVIIEFSYTEEEIVNTIPEALGIAYQDSRGIWMAQGGTELDKTNKKIRVTTNHFSDWSLFESVFLSTSATVVPVNGTAQLEVYTTEDLLVPLVPGQQIAMGKKISMAAKYVKEWKLSGAGNLQSNGPKATYKAPAVVPNVNPVAVSVKLDLKQRGTFILVKNIEVQNDDGEIEVRVAGGTWVKKTASPAVRMGTGYAIADSDGDTQGSYVLIQWIGETGTHPFRNPLSTSGTYTHYLVTNGENYTCSYISGEELIASGGGVTITSMGDDDGFIKGTFDISPAGYGPQLKNTIRVEGKFRVRKGW
jgi:hypothetical protein